MHDTLPFPSFTFSGDHREVGRQHGEALRPQIAQHLDLIYFRGFNKSGLTRERALEMALGFLPFIERYTPGFAAEIQGLAEGAGRTLAEAVLLQVRQEVAHIGRFGEPAPDQEETLECTTFAVTDPYTKAGNTYSGQNADLSGPLEEFSVVAKMAVTGKPAVMMLLPAGQISYIGMNSEGMSACANFLNCRGWRTGYPRYLLSRLALEQRSIDQAVEAVLQPKRASSRNMLLADREGRMVDIENTVTQHALLTGEGYIVHSNHYLHPELLAFESSKQEEILNSRARYERLKELIESQQGEITIGHLKAAYRDHANYPDSVCAHRQPPKDTHTFASMICTLAAGKMDVAKGPPCQNDYATYRL